METLCLCLVRGDDQTVGIYVQNPDGTPYNLSGATLTFTARDDYYNAPIILQKVVTSHFGAASGASSINFTSGDTATGFGDKKYFFDIKLLSSLNLVTTLGAGQFSLYPQ